MRYAEARSKDYEDLFAYRFYISEMQKSIANAMIRLAGGSEVEYSYSDIILGKVPKPDNRTSEEIISDIKDKLDNFGKEV